MAKAPGPTPPGLVGDFAQYLRDLAIQAGKPDYTQMRKATSYGRSALSAAFAGKKLPAWELTAKLVHCLGGDVDAARGRWAAAKRTQIQLRSAGEPASRRAGRWRVSNPIRLSCRSRGSSPWTCRISPPGEMSSARLMLS